MPAAKLARVAPNQPIHHPDGVILTTGTAARLACVCPRTLTKWCETGALAHWKLPCSQDRRLFAHDLRAFLLRHNAHVPSELDALCGARRDLVLYQCQAAVAAAVAAQAPAGVEVRRVEDVWELSQLLSRPFASGVLVVGDGVPVSEVERLFARLPAGWVKVHAPGCDQSPAAGADHVISPDAGVSLPILGALAGAA